VRGMMLCALLGATSACLVTTTDAGGQGGGTTSPGPGIYCDTACGANASCAPSGACECYAGYTECPGSDGGTGCTDVLLDDNNCGGCGITCPDGESCLGGYCTCHLTTCTYDGGFSTCTDLESDPLNCDVCGHVCPEGEDCLLGACSCSPSRTILQCATDGGLACVDLTEDDDGGCGSFGCLCDEDGGTCGPGSGACADLTTDPYNCGTCGNVCPTGSCILGDAGTGVCNCPFPYVWCPENDGGPVCVDTYSDFNHCGFSCAACPPTTTQCVEGHCR